MQVICNLTPTKLYFILSLFNLFMESKVSGIGALLVYYKITAQKQKKQRDDG